MASACSTLIALTTPAATAAPAVDIYSGTWETGHHASWGYGKFQQHSPGAAVTFDITEGRLGFVLDNDGLLTYTISNFDCDFTEEGQDLQTLTLYGSRSL